MTWYLKFVFISKLRILHDGPIIYIIELVPCKYPKEAMLKKTGTRSQQMKYLNV
jgi:hypothetical protein